MNITKNQLLSFSTVSGAALIYSYYYYLKDKSTQSINKYWGGISGNTRKIYTISMLLCVISMIIITKQIYDSNKKSFNTEFVGMFLLIIVSMFYMPLTINYVNNPTLMDFINIVSVLFYVALGSIILYKEYPGYASGYLVFHLIVLDLIYWSYNFFNF